MWIICLKCGLLKTKGQFLQLTLPDDIYPQSFNLHP